MASMALNASLPLACSIFCLKEAINLRPFSLSSFAQPFCFKKTKNLIFHLLSSNFGRNRNSRTKPLNAVKLQSSESDTYEEEDDPINKERRVASDPYLMNEKDRLEMRIKIREVLDSNPVVEEEIDPVQRKIKMQRMIAVYPLVVEEDDPD